MAIPTPAQAIKGGLPDEGAHPYVGQLLFYDPSGIDPRFDDPGAWFNCSGTLVSPTIVVTAGHCTFGTGRNGDPTPTGSGGNDVWISFAENRTTASCFPVQTSSPTTTRADTGPGRQP